MTLIKAFSFRATAFSILALLLVAPQFAAGQANQAPVLTVPSGPFTFNEDTSNTIAGISVADPDVGASNLVVNLRATNGLIFLSSVTGLTFTNGANGSAAMAFRGGRTNINTALNNLAFVGRQNTNNVNHGGGDVFYINVNDLGNNGTGGAQQATSTFAVNLTAVNDRPVLNGPFAVLSNEDAQVFIPFTVTDADVPETPATNFTLKVSLYATNGNAYLSNTNALTFLAGDATQTNGTNVIIQGNITNVNNAISGLLFLPKPNFNGTGTVTIIADDLGSSGSGGALTTSRTVVITLTAVNDGPILGIPGIVVGNQNTNIFVDMNGAFGDRDIAETPTGTFITVTMVSTNGNIHLGSTNNLTILSGSNDTTNISFQAAITNANAAVVPMYFSSTTNFVGNGTISITMSDNGFTGSGGAKTTNGTITVTVLDINYAPVLDNSATFVLTTINEDTTNTGDTVTSIISSAGGDPITDQDPGSPEGFAVMGVDDSNGTWQWSTNAGTSFSSFGVVGDGAAVLLNGNARIRFVPALDFNGSAAITFRAWDQHTGANGATNVDTGSNGGQTPYSTNTDTASIIVNPVNDAPALDNTTNMSLTAINEDDTGSAGDTVTNIIVSAGVGLITDPDAGSIQGYAVVGRDNANGVWQYSTNSGVSFTAFGVLSDNAATLLNESAVIRFVPGANFNGVVGFVFRAWDGSTGTNGAVGVDVSVNGGSNAYSSVAETGTITVLPQNEAPVLDSSGAMSLPGILENNFTNSGTAVSNVIASAGGDRITDLDPGALEGIAIIGANNTKGSWQFSTDGGVNWSNVGSPTNDAALLVAAADLVRFVPNPSISGVASFTFRAWDQTSGVSGNFGIDASVNGDPTAFSTNTETATITIIPDNVAPVLDNTGAMSLTAIFKNNTNSLGDNVANIIASAGGDRITDADTNAVEGMAVIGADNSNGDWQYSLNNGATWLPFGAVADASAVQVDASAKIRFAPNLNFTGIVSFVFRAWDQTDGAGDGATGVDATVNGGLTAYSTASETVDIDVVDFTVNIAPVLDNSGTMTLSNLFEDAFTNTGDYISNIIASAGGDRITDSNVGNPEGIAVVSVVLSNGAWQYSTDDAAHWDNFFSVSETTAVVLADSARIRFIPNANFGGNSGPITFRAWDGSDGKPSGQAGMNTSTNGGLSAFSSAEETADLTVLPMADLLVTKQAVGSIVAGTIVQYRIAVTNFGPTHATNVIVTDTLPPEVTPTNTVVTNLGVVFQGGSRSVFVSVNLAPNRRGALTNVVSVVSDVFDVNTTNNLVTNITAITASADLVITKVSSPDPALEGKPMTYTVVVSNKGPSYALGVVATDALPATVTFVSASAGCTFSGGNVSCNIGTLPNGSRTSFTVSVTVSGSAFGTTLTNSVTVSSTDPDPATNNNTAVLATAVVNGNAPHDFDGDGASDVGVIQPGTFVWTISPSSSSVVTQQFGFGTVVPVPADYDGDGKMDFAVFDPATATWYISRTTAGFLVQQFGFAAVTPVPADYDGDGKADIAVYHPPSGMWYLMESSAGFQSVQFGYQAAVPVPADYDGDGKDDLAVFDTGPSSWYLLRSSAGFTAQQFGFSGVKPVPGDYDGDEKADIAVFHNPDATWYLLQSTAGFAIQQFGYNGVIPLPGDYDGDDKCDFGVYDPNSAFWYLLESTDGFESFQLGSPGSTPFVIVR